MILARLLLFALAIYFLWRLFFARSRGAGKSETQREQSRRPEEMKQDPVCGTWVPVSQALKIETKGEPLYFCSQACRERFQESETADRES